MFRARARARVRVEDSIRSTVSVILRLWLGL